MGVKGAALATILYAGLQCLVGVAFPDLAQGHVEIERRYMRPDRRIIGAHWPWACPRSSWPSTESLVGFVLNSGLKVYGDIYISALAIMQVRCWPSATADRVRTRFYSHRELQLRPREP